MFKRGDNGKAIAEIKIQDRLNSYLFKSEVPFLTDFDPKCSVCLWTAFIHTWHTIRQSHKIEHFLLSGIKLQISTGETPAARRHSSGNIDIFSFVWDECTQVHILLEKSQCPTTSKETLSDMCEYTKIKWSRLRSCSHFFACLHCVNHSSNCNFYTNFEWMRQFWFLYVPHSVPCSFLPC